MDVAGAAVLSGHVAASLARNACSVVITLAVAVAIGFRPVAGVAQWVGAAGLLALFVLTVSWLSAAFGLVARTPEGASGFGFFVMFLPYPSSAFVPIETMPGWLRGFAEHQPATPVIETLRALLLGTPMGASALAAVAWCVGLILVSIALAAALYRKRIG
jgi:ABC-2 type transport system permease protein